MVAAAISVGALYVRRRPPSRPPWTALVAGALDPVRRRRRRAGDRRRATGVVVLVAHDATRACSGWWRRSCSRWARRSRSRCRHRRRPTKTTLLRVLHGRVATALAHPVVGWALFGGTLVAYYLSPLFEASLQHSWLHALVHAALLRWSAACSCGRSSASTSCRGRCRTAHGFSPFWSRCRSMRSSAWRCCRRPHRWRRASTRRSTTNMRPPESCGRPASCSRW